MFPPGQIQSRRHLSADPQAREKAVKAGYDIHTSAQVLQQFYLRRYAEVTK